VGVGKKMYRYWIPLDKRPLYKPDETPEGCQYWCSGSRRWKKERMSPQWWDWIVRRWPCDDTSTGAERSRVAFEKYKPNL
jgi:hypothetical protein